jgi:hypothetical protein
MRDGQSEKTDREQRGADRQHRTAAAQRNCATDPERDDARRQQAE